MVDVGIYTKNATIVILAGKNAGTTEVSVTETDKYVLFVEAQIDVRTTTDWSTKYTAGDLDTTLRDVLSLPGAAGCAMIAVNANPTKYPARQWETTLSVLNSIYEEGIKSLSVDDGAGLVKGDT